MTIKHRHHATLYIGHSFSICQNLILWSNHKNWWGTVYYTWLFWGPLLKNISLQSHHTSPPHRDHPLIWVESSGPTAVAVRAQTGTELVLPWTSTECHKHALWHWKRASPDTLGLGPKCPIHLVAFSKYQTPSEYSACVDLCFLNTNQVQRPNNADLNFLDGWHPWQLPIRAVIFYIRDIKLVSHRGPKLVFLLPAEDRKWHH